MAGNAANVNMQYMTQHTLAVGQEVFESWLYEPFESVENAKDQIKQQMIKKAIGFQVSLSEPTFEDVLPDDERVAPFVDHNEWPLGTRCIIGTAIVTMSHGVFKRPEERGAEFIADLDAESLAWLRKSTRDVAAVYNETLTDAECDVIIAERGPEVAESIVRKMKDGK